MNYIKNILNSRSDNDGEFFFGTKKNFWDLNPNEKTTTLEHLPIVL